MGKTKQYMIAASLLAGKATYPKTIVFTNTSINAEDIFAKYSKLANQDVGYSISLVDFKMDNATQQIQFNYQSSNAKYHAIEEPLWKVE